MTPAHVRQIANYSADGGRDHAVAFVLTTPVNKWMIGRGKGHAVVHALHGAH
ncbi:hypothetical protein [Nocardia sp. R7R-8]|uniref:hypothetical protein n=1 Tax=Nocardia sp. R7R-8 TaxID=3459304 RepID=UPI00403E1735